MRTHSTQAFLTLGEEGGERAWTEKPENVFFPGELEIVVGELYLRVISKGTLTSVQRTWVRKPFMILLSRNSPCKCEKHHRYRARSGRASAL